VIFYGGAAILAPALLAGSSRSLVPGQAFLEIARRVRFRSRQAPRLQAGMPALPRKSTLATCNAARCKLHANGKKIGLSFLPARPRKPLGDGKKIWLLNFRRRREMFYLGTTLYLPRS